MDAERWARLKEVFSTVIAFGPNRALTALHSECQGDDDLLRQVRPLVEEHFHLQNTGQTAAAPELEAPGPTGLVAGRFKVQARLGGGGFGDVYRVSDAGGEPLALKILRSSDPLALLYFKREFRSLADIYHPNIIALHELIADSDRWMFTMELVDGVDLLRYLDAQPLADRDAAARACFMQIADGLQALHERNLLHRDLKPSNVLVSAAGRLVLLDFGLVRAFGEDFQHNVTFAGTPDYMSPEQAVGAPLGEPSDWYAVGVMLYQFLTGERPFAGSAYEVLRQKQHERPVPPIDMVASLPAELNDLCMKLLEPDPAKRASYADVVSLLGPTGAAPMRESPGAPFVGRAEPLHWLADAYAAAEAGPVLVHVQGPSGIGKSALLREFIRRLGKEPSALIFAGRCYEGESVPYQAIDDLIDHIGEHLHQLSPERVEQLLPRNFAVLAKMFPVLSRFLPSHAARIASLDSTDLRTRALGALREMLGRFAERHRIVLVIDDLQWGDADGCAALNDLLSSSDSPPVLAVLAYRSEDFDASPWIEALRETSAQPSNRKTILIRLDQLGSTDAAELAGYGLAGPVEPTTLQHVVGQSGGSPFLIHEIVRWINGQGDSLVLPEPFSLADVVRSRVNDLGAGSRHFLELVAVAGQPTELSVLQVAGGVTKVLTARDELSAARFIRLRSGRGREEVEVYHDRIRAALLADMDAATLVLRHRELALALSAAEGNDPERIAAHFEQAQEPQLCARYAFEAARRAVEVLAFNKAARFFEMALGTETLSDGDRRITHRECADALANAGRGPEAAEHYLASCTGATIDEQLEPNLRAAEQLLSSGHVDRGLAIFGGLLAQVGIQLPETPSQMTLDLLFRRVLLKVRGLRWRETRAADVPRNTLLRIDTCASVARGLSLIDVARGAALQATTLSFALRAGEPSRIARALAMEAAYVSTAGIRAEGRVEDLLAMARELAGRTGDQPAMGLAAVMAAACAWNAGHWAECYRLARAAREALRERHDHVTWERDTASIFEVDGLRWMGRWSVMKAILPELLEDARQRGDLYALAVLQMHGGSCAELANDDPVKARSGLGILERWSRTGFHVEHLVEMHTQAEIAIYLGNAGEALDLVTRRWPALRGSLLLRVQAFNIQMRSLRARVALRAALEGTSGSQRPDLLRLARREVRAIERQGTIWGRALAELIRGQTELLAGRREEAVATFQQAETAAVSAGMFLHTAVARRAQGLLMGGDAGAQLLAGADRDLRSEGITNTERFAAVMAPAVHSGS